MNIEMLESEAEASVTLQIEADQFTYYHTSPPTSSEIYAMCAESDTADQFARWLCGMAGVAFPPVNEGVPS